MSQALKATFSGFTKEQQRLGIPKGENRTTFTLTYERLRKLCSSAQLTQVFILSDPRQWTENHVVEWLTWTVNEFSLKNVDFDKFCINGASLCAMGKDRFLDLAPDFVGDILWEHLEMLQKGKRPHSLSEQMTSDRKQRLKCCR